VAQHGPAGQDGTAQTLIDAGRGACGAIPHELGGRVRRPRFTMLHGYRDIDIAVEFAMSDEDMTHLDRLVTAFARRLGELSEVDALPAGFDPGPLGVVAADWGLRIGRRWARCRPPCIRGPSPPGGVHSTLDCPWTAVA
jgi:hypothetical protein